MKPSLGYLKRLIPLLALLMFFASCAKTKEQGGSTGGNPFRSNLPLEISIDAQ